MKSKLNLSDLTVDSFETISQRQGLQGTVRAHDQETWTGPCNTCDATCNGAATCNTCPGGGQTDIGCGGTKWWENTCAPQYTCANHSCHMTGAGCNCNYTEGACTYGVQETCAGWNPPCPV